MEVSVNWCQQNRIKFTSLWRR